MNRYTSGKIYKIVSAQTDRIYIGSTTEPTLARRMAGHRANYRVWVNGNGHYITSFEMLQHDDAEIVLVERFPCNSKDELHAREQFHIDGNANCVNKHKAFTGMTRQEYDRQYREDNREHKQQYIQQYREDNREKLQQYIQQYRNDNLEILKQYYNTKHECDCGGKYTTANKSKHLKSQYHQQQIRYRNELIVRITEQYDTEEDWTNATMVDLEEMVV